MCSLSNKNIIVYLFFVLVLFVMQVRVSFSEDEMYGYSIGGCSKKYIGIKCLSKTNFDFSRFELGSSSFTDIVNIFGKAMFFKKPDDTRKYLCYLNKTNNNIMFIEFGGYPSNVGHSIVSELTITLDNKMNNTKMCGVLNDRESEVVPSSGLTLNLNKEKFMNIINMKDYDFKDNFDFGGGYIDKARKDFVNQGLSVKFSKNMIFELQYQISMEPL